MRRLLRAPHRDERGTALIEFTWLGLLMLVPLVYVVVAVFAVQRTAYAASAAARSATRAYVTAPDQASAYARAAAAARLAFTDQGIEAPAYELQVGCRPSPAACLSPGSVVTVRVASAARLPLMPAFLGRSAPRVAVDAEHAEPYGTFREARP